MLDVHLITWLRGQVMRFRMPTEESESVLKEAADRIEQTSPFAEKLARLRDFFTEGQVQDLLEAAARSPSLLLIARERLRQISVEGYTPAHDDSHPGEMALAASAYAENAGQPSKCRPDCWPWEDRAWKPTTPERDLEKAGALVLAEMDSLARRNNVIAAQPAGGH